MKTCTDFSPWWFTGRCAEIRVIDRGHSFATATAERDAYRAMLCDVIASASPNKRDHPSMSKQWERATELLRDGVR